MNFRTASKEFDYEAIGRAGFAGHSPVGSRPRMGVGAPVAARVPFASLARSSRRLATRSLNACAPGNHRADKKFRASLEQTSREVGELMGALSLTPERPMNPALAQRIMKGLLGSMGPMTSQGADPTEIFKARVDHNLQQMSAQELVALRAGLFSDSNVQFSHPDYLDYMQEKSGEALQRQLSRESVGRRFLSDMETAACPRFNWNTHMAELAAKDELNAWLTSGVMDLDHAVAWLRDLPLPRVKQIADDFVQQDCRTESPDVPHNITNLARARLCRDLGEAVTELAWYNEQRFKAHASAGELSLAWELLRSGVSVPDPIGKAHALGRLCIDPGYAGDEDVLHLATRMMSSGIFGTRGAYRFYALGMPVGEPLEGPLEVAKGLLAAYGRKGRWEEARNLVKSRRLDGLDAPSTRQLLDQTLNAGALRKLLTISLNKDLPSYEHCFDVALALVDRLVPGEPATKAAATQFLNAFSQTITGGELLQRAATPQWLARHGITEDDLLALQPTDEPVQDVPAPENASHKEPLPDDLD
jgi:hypothetical protein